MLTFNYPHVHQSNWYSRLFRPFTLTINEDLLTISPTPSVFFKDCGITSTFCLLVFLPLQLLTKTPFDTLVVSITFASVFFLIAYITFTSRLEQATRYIEFNQSTCTCTINSFGYTFDFKDITSVNVVKNHTYLGENTRYALNINTVTFGKLSLLSHYSPEAIQAEAELLANFVGINNVTYLLNDIDEDL